MTSKLTRERIELIANFHRAMTLPPSHAEIEELARMVLDAMDSEPVAWTDEEELRDVNVAGIGYLFGIDREANKFADPRRQIMLYHHAPPAKGLELAGWQFKSVNGDWLGLIDEHGKNQAVREGCEVREVFAMADGVNERDQVRREHAEWSQATFGDVGPIGPLKHLSKEALEAAAEPCDLSEWADMQFLLWDAQRRAGITDDQITQAMIEKLAVNKQREWPEPKDGEPRLHIKEQPAPVVPEEKPMPNPLSMYAVDAVAAIAEAKGWNACRAAMLQAGNSPVIPDTWIPVSERMPEDEQEVLTINKMGHRFVSFFDKHSGLFFDRLDAPAACCIERVLVTHWMPLPAAPQEVKSES